MNNRSFKILLVALLALPHQAHTQDLVSADGTEWRYVATGRASDGAKFNVFARRAKGVVYPELEIKVGETVTRAEHDCKRKLYRLKNTDEWLKPKGSVGERLIKFACGREQKRIK